MKLGIPGGRGRVGRQRNGRPAVLRLSAISLGDPDSQSTCSLPRLEFAYRKGIVQFTEVGKQHSQRHIRRQCVSKGLDMVEQPHPPPDDRFPG